MPSDTHVFEMKGRKIDNACPASGWLHWRRLNVQMCAHQPHLLHGCWPLKAPG